MITLLCEASNLTNWPNASSHDILSKHDELAIQPLHCFMRVSSLSVLLKDTYSFDSYSPKELLSRAFNNEKTLQILFNEYFAVKTGAFFRKGLTRVYRSPTSLGHYLKQWNGIKLIPCPLPILSVLWGKNCKFMYQSVQYNYCTRRQILIWVYCIFLFITSNAHTYIYLVEKSATLRNS